MRVEISPVPSELERAAIERALASVGIAGRPCEPGEWWRRGNEESVLSEEGSPASALEEDRRSYESSSS